MNEVSTRRTDSGASILYVLLGMWLIISPFVVTPFHHMQNLTWNNVIVGILVGIVGLLQINDSDMAHLRWWNVVLGVWLIISPFALGFSAMTGAMWHNIIMGVLVALMAWSRAVVPHSLHLPNRS